VIHFAANAAVAESMEDPYKYLHNNVASSLELLEAMREAAVRRMVFSSTCAVYGMPRRAAIHETASLSPVNPYGESKLFVERALKWYETLHGFSWAALRYFNAAGADPDGEIGEEHNPETHLIPSAIQAALGQRQTVDVMGTDYPTSDGTAIRDYTHVADLADAHIRALEYLKRGRKSAAFNLGTGHGRSVRDVVAAVERVSGRPVPVRETARRPGDPPTLVAGNKRARAALRWKPRYENLDAIIRTAWAWHSGRLNSRRATAAS
jgi:UDP-glucose-4-epimerase GalE